MHRRLSVLMGFWTRISYRRANHCTKHPKGETFALSQAEMSACVGSQKVRLIISPLLLFLSLIVRSFSPSLNRTAQTSGRIRIMSSDIEDKKDAAFVENGPPSFFSTGQPPVMRHGEGGVRLGLQSRQ